MDRDKHETRMAAEKAAWRERFRSARLTLSADQRARAADAITERALGLPDVRDAATVHAYWPLVERGEVDTRGLIEALVSRGTTVVLPVVASRRGEAPRLRHFVFEGEDTLVESPWGLRQPPLTAREVPPSEIDVVIVPAFGAGRNGHRIGHGAGFYDAFLADCPATRIGVVYDACLVETLPHEPHDIPLDIILTERERVGSARSAGRRPAGPATATEAVA